MVFAKPGRENTRETIELALRTAREENIRDIVIATVEGNSPLLLHDTEGLNIVVVTHSYGYRDTNGNPLRPENRAEMERRGYTIYTAAHALSGAERALSAKFAGVYPVEIIAHTLRMFGQGTKVCVEVAAMACDAGLIQPGDRVIAIGGTVRGEDTAMILRPGYTHTLLDTKIERYLCKPVV